MSAPTAIRHRSWIASPRMGVERRMSAVGAPRWIGLAIRAWGCGHCDVACACGPTMPKPAHQRVGTLALNGNRLQMPDLPDQAFSSQNFSASSQPRRRKANAIRTCPAWMSATCRAWNRTTQVPLPPAASLGWRRLPASAGSVGDPARGFGVRAQGRARSSACTASASGSTSCQSRNATAAWSTSMPRPSSAVSAPAALAQPRKPLAAAP